MSPAEQLELIRRRDQPCEHCIEPDELAEIVAVLDHRDARSKPHKPGEHLSEEYQAALQDKALHLLDSQLRLLPRQGESDNISSILHILFLMLDHDRDGHASLDELHTSLFTVISVLMPDNKMFHGKPSVPIDLDNLDAHQDGLATVALHDTLTKAHEIIHNLSDHDQNGLVSEIEFSHTLRLLYTAAVDLFHLQILDKIDFNHPSNHKPNGPERKTVTLTEAKAWLDTTLAQNCAQLITKYAKTKTLSLLDLLEMLIQGMQTAPEIRKCLGPQPK
eukprot:c14948_g1_i3.p1 GENE.c14948_g1_i3~~c14948_g1_i3.p1  ORF type:complete len:307 (-),score=69.35 c14948_g1_i3:238-1065(-)